MTVDFTGLKAAVVGGFGGIGQGICKHLLNTGVAQLTVLDLNEDATTVNAWKSLYPDRSIFFSYIDVTNRVVVRDAIIAAKDKMKGLDIFINSSGVLQDDQPDFTIQINLLGPIYTTLEAVNVMGKHKGGNGGIIANVASVLGLVPCYQLAIYTASKHGVVGLTRSLGHEYHFNVTGINFMAICPGITVTPLMTNVNAATFDYANGEICRFFDAKTQHPDICGENIVKTIQSGKNGSVWICDLGMFKEVDIPEYWKCQFE